MSKHTPGPWEAFYKNKYQEWHVSLPARDSDTMRINLCPDGVIGHDLSEQEANAKLIAAAIEMLQIIKELLYGEDFDGKDVLHVDAELIHRANAVVLKAEGKTK